jgi:tetratricopeptide (TPR) repeat protein
MRLLAQAVDLLKDWDGTFFPLVQDMEGRRVFLTLNMELPFEKMANFVPSGLPVEWICSGTLSDQQLRIKIFATSTKLLFREISLKLPLDPLNLLQGLYFKFWEALDLPTPIPRLPQISLEATPFWLAARDRLLALELEVQADQEDWYFEAALRGLEVEPGHPSLVGYLVRTAWIASEESQTISSEGIARALGKALSENRLHQTSFSKTARELFFKTITQLAQMEDRQDPEAMNKIAKKAIFFAPRLPDAWYLWGLAKSKQSKPHSAIRALKRALDLNPEMKEARSLLGACYLTLEKPELAYAELKGTLEQGSKSYGLLLHLAQACSLTSRREEGLHYIEQAKVLAPERSEAERVESEFF